MYKKCAHQLKSLSIILLTTNEKDLPALKLFKIMSRFLADKLSGISLDWWSLTDGGGRIMNKRETKFSAYASDFPMINQIPNKEKSMIFFVQDSRKGVRLCLGVLGIYANV